MLPLRSYFVSRRDTKTSTPDRVGSDPLAALPERVLAAAVGIPARTQLERLFRGCRLVTAAGRLRESFFRSGEASYLTCTINPIVAARFVSRCSAPERFPSVSEPP